MDRRSEIVRERNFTNNPMSGKVGPLNHQWKGDEVGYNGLHKWARETIEKPELCEKCKQKSPEDLHNIPGTYKRNPKDWTWVCRSCHMKLDGRDKRGD